MEKLLLKKEILDKCKVILIEQMKIQEKAMDDAQEEANFHKGAMESRYDSFKEEAQRKKDAHAKQHFILSELFKQASSLTLKQHSTIQFGSLVETSLQNFFILGYLGTDPIVIEENKYLPISLISPLGKLLFNKKAGDIITFNNKSIQIISVT